MVLDPWNIVAETDILETFLVSVNVVLSRDSAKDIDVDNGRVSTGEARVDDVTYTKL